MNKPLRDLPDDFQLDQLRACLAFVSDFSCALDVGAHRGIWSRELLKHFKEVHSFEPVKELFEQIPDSCHKYNVACGDMGGRCSIKEGRRNTGQGMVSAGNDVGMEILDSYNLAPTFMKIDVEGYEYNVLKGAKQTIMTHKPIILIEENGLGKHHGNYDFRASALLEKWGMKKKAEFYVKPEPDLNILFVW